MVLLSNNLPIDKGLLPDIKMRQTLKHIGASRMRIFMSQFTLTVPGKPETKYAKCV